MGTTLRVATLVVVVGALLAGSCSSDGGGRTDPLDGCGLVLPSTSVEGEGYPTAHTVVSGTEPLTFELDVRPKEVCPGGRVDVDIRIDNTGSSVVHQFTGALSLVCGGPVKILVASVGPIDIEPGASRTSVQFAAPLASCTAGLSVYGYAGGTNLVIKPPRADAVPATCAIDTPAGRAPCTSG